MSKKRACFGPLAAVLSTVFLLGSLFSAQPARAQCKDQRHLVEVGLFAGADFLSSKHGLFDESVGYEPFKPTAFELGLRVGYMPLPYVGVELETSMSFARTTEEGFEMATLYSLRGHVVGQYPVWKKLAIFGVLGGGMLGVQSDPQAVGDDLDWAMHWGVGVKYQFTKWMGLRVDVRHMISDGRDDKMANHFALLGGLTVVFGWKENNDKDNDGVEDSKDKCPKKPGLKPDGCPDTDGDGVSDDKDRCPKIKGDDEYGCPKDSDGDGVADAEDKCPQKAGAKPHGCPDSDGDGVYDHQDKCPKIKGDDEYGCPKDADGDGVSDAEDKCPQKAGAKPHGCPDSDGDGVYDHQDKCPNVKGDGADGCVQDKDKDGVPDAEDKCPGKPETKNGFQDKDGCPDELPKEVKRFTGAIKGIYFARGSAKIRRKSFRVLNAALAVLKKYPMLRIKVRGHTDSRGSDQHNLRLSSNRAKAVADFFVSKGVAKNRIESEGAGSKEPVASNKKASGRAKNRRIEIKILH